MKKVLSLTIIPVFLLSSCGKNEEVITKNEIKPKYVKTMTVEKKPFYENISLVGKVISDKETNISPLVSGIINKVNVKVGDRVKSGDILATIDTKSNLIQNNISIATDSYQNTVDILNATIDSTKKDLETARINLENAKLSRDNVYKITESQLKLAETQLKNIDTQLGNTSKTSESSIELAQKSLDNAKLNLENFEKNYEKSINSLYIKRKNLISSIEAFSKSAISSIDSSLTTADTILGVTDKNKNLNDSYENYLSAKNTSYKTLAEDQFNFSLRLYNEYLFNEKDLQGLNKLEMLENLLDNAINLYDNLVKILDNSITSSSFPQSMLDGLKSNIKGNQSQLLAIKSNLVSLKGSLKDLDTTIESTITNGDTTRASLKQAIVVAENNLENTKNSLKTNLDSLAGSKDLTKNQLQSTIDSIKQSRDQADKAVEIAQSNYDAIKAKLDSSVLSVKNQLNSVKSQKNAALEQLNNSIIKAPFDGIITAKNVEVGSSVSPAAPAFVLSNDKNKVIRVDVSSQNVKYLSLGKEVIIKKGTLSGTGIITLVSNSPDVVTRMFRVDISIFDDEFKKSVILGEYVDVSIKKDLDYKTGIVIPFSSLVVSSSNNYSVYVVDNNNIVKQVEVEVEDSNSFEVLVSRGLNVGDKIIVNGTLNVLPGEKVSEM